MKAEHDSLYWSIWGQAQKKKCDNEHGSFKKIKANNKKENLQNTLGELLKHVFKYDVSNCDHCATKLVLVASITSRYICNKILPHLELPIYEVVTRSPRGPPEVELNIV